MPLIVCAKYPSFLIRILPTELVVVCPKVQLLHQRSVFNFPSQDECFPSKISFQEQNEDPVFPPWRCLVDFWFQGQYR